MASSPKSGSLLYAHDENPPFRESLFSGLQMVLLVAGPIIVTPLIVTRAIGLDMETTRWVVFATIIGSALATFLQVRRVGPVGSGLLIFMGTSGSYIAVGLDAAMIGGMALVGTLAILSAPVQWLFAYYFAAFRRIITPTVGGTVVLLVGLTVLPIATGIMQQGLAPEQEGAALGVAGLTIGVILFFAIIGRRLLRLFSPLLGLGSGLIAATVLGLTDFSQVGKVGWIGLPPMAWPGLSFSFSPEILALLVAFMIITLIGAVESVGDTMATEEASTRNFRKVDYNRVRGGLYADGFGNAIAGALCTLPNTTYAISISTIRVTGMAARRVGYFGAAILGLFAFSPKFSAAVIALPGPVLGAYLFVVIALLFVSGIKLCASEELSFENGLIIGISFAMGFVFDNQMIFPDLIPAGIAPFVNNGMAVGGVTAIGLSLMFNLRPRPRGRIVLPAKTPSIPELSSYLSEFGKRVNLGRQAAYDLQLCGEEVFLYLLKSAPEDTEEHFIDIRMEKEEFYLWLEVIDSKDPREIDDEALGKTTNWPEVEEEKLQELGLYLLHQTAGEIRHREIGGTHFISFQIPLDRPQRK